MFCRIYQVDCHVHIERVGVDVQFVAIKEYRRMNVLNVMVEFV